MMTEMVPRLRRYWYVVVSGLLVSVLVAGAVIVVTPATYEATRCLLLVPSPTSEDPDLPRNPFFSYINDSLFTPILVMSIMLSDENVARQVAPEGSGIDYTVGRTTTVAAPVMDIVVTAPTPDVADATADKLTELVESTLREQQDEAGGPESTWMSAKLISSSVQPERVWTKPVQLAVSAFTVTALLTLVLIAMLQWRADRRRTRGVARSDGSNAELKNLERTLR